MQMSGWGNCENCGREYGISHVYTNGHSFCCEGCAEEFFLKQQTLQDVQDMQGELQAVQENIQEIQENLQDVRENIQDIQDKVREVQDNLDDFKSEINDSSIPDKAEIKNRIKSCFRPGDDMLTVKAIELAAVYHRRFDPFKLMFALGMTAGDAASMMRKLYDRGCLADNVVTACEMFRPGTEKYVSPGDTAAMRAAVIMAGYWRGIDKNRLSQA